MGESENLQLELHERIARGQEYCQEAIKFLESHDYGRAETATDDAIGAARAVVEWAKSVGLSEDVENFDSEVRQSLYPLRDELERLSDIDGIIERELRNHGIQAKVRRGEDGLAVSATIPDGVSREELDQALEAVNRQLAKEFPILKVKAPSFETTEGELPSRPASLAGTEGPEKDTRCWLSFSGKVYGPYDSAQIKRFVDEGRVRPDTQVCPVEGRRIGRVL